MKIPIEYFKFAPSLNIQENEDDQNLKDDYLNKRINNNPYLYSEFSKYIYYNFLIKQKIQINFLKLPPNIKIDDKFNEEAKTNKILNGKKDIKNQLLKNNTNNLISSEIKKFKTELCHSWELTGTCKYGINVSQ